MLKTFAVAVAALATVQGANIRGTETAAPASDVDVYGPNGDPSGLALTKMQDTEALINAGYAKSQSICVDEEAKTVAWSEEVQDMGAKARAASKQQLAGALEKRLAGLKKFLKRLKKMRARLREHIIRVNTIYETKYTENLNNVHLAANVLKELGMIQTEPWNPHINPIKNFDSFAAAAVATPAVEVDSQLIDGATGLDGATTAAASATTPPATFIQLNDATYQSAGSECKAATGAAFNVYELGLKLNSMMDTSFENERVVLKEFRETLKLMIDKREAKLAAMEEQLRKLKLAMAAANSPFTELKEGLKDHLEHVKNACAAHAKQKIVVSASVANVVAMIQEHHMDATGGAATGSSF